MKKYTSVAGSNKFFSSRHSLGLPTGSEAGEESTWPGSVGAGVAACPLTTKGCCTEAVLLSTGTPSVPAMLQSRQQRLVHEEGQRKEKTQNTDRKNRKALLTLKLYQCGPAFASTMLWT